MNRQKPELNMFDDVIKAIVSNDAIQKAAKKQKGAKNN